MRIVILTNIRDFLGMLQYLRKARSTTGRQGTLGIAQGPQISCAKKTFCRRIKLRPVSSLP